MTGGQQNGPASRVVQLSVAGAAAAAVTGGEAAAVSSRSSQSSRSSRWRDRAACRESGDPDVFFPVAAAGPVLAVVLVLVLVTATAGPAGCGSSTTAPGRAGPSVPSVLSSVGVVTGERLRPGPDRTAHFVAD